MMSDAAITLKTGSQDFLDFVSIFHPSSFAIMRTYRFFAFSVAG